MSSASRELFASQPSVTQALAKFEAQLGIRIFQRCATGCYPTKKGQHYLLRIDCFLKILDDAITHILQPTGRKDRNVQQVSRLLTGTQLRALIAISDQAQVHENARSLGLSLATLLRSVRTLERTLATPLLTRCEEGLITTRSGSYLADEFRRAVRQIELAHEAMLVTQDASPEITVGILPMAGSQILAETLQKFRASHPSVRVRLISGEYHKLFSDLISNRIDMIFGTLRMDDETGYVSREILFRDSYCLVTRPDHPLTRYKKIVPAELAHFPWVGSPSGTPERTRIDALFNGSQTRPDFYLETTSQTLSRELLLSSDMMTLMSRSAAQDDINHGILSALYCSFLDDVQLKGVLTRCDWLPPPVHHAFLQELRTVTARRHPVQPMGIRVRPKDPLLT